jgi:hypothetical protein
MQPVQPAIYHESSAAMLQQQRAMPAMSRRADGDPTACSEECEKQPPHSLVTIEEIRRLDSFGVPPRHH